VSGYFGECVFRRDYQKQKNTDKTEQIENQKKTEKTEKNDLLLF
jgi:hypothetical protein